MTVLSFEIIIRGGVSRIDCLVRDVFDSGCHLVMPNTAVVPSRFTLRIKQDGRQFLAKVSRRDARSVCVQFDDTNYDFSFAA